MKSMAPGGSPRRLGAAWPVWAGLGLVVALGGAWITLRNPAAPENPGPSPRPPQVAQAAPAAPPSVDIVRASPQGSAVIAGRAQPGAHVIVRDGTQELGQAQADQSGAFVLVPSAPLPPGGHTLTLASRDGTAAEIRGQDSVMVVVPSPQAPAQATGPPLPAVALAIPQSGPPRLLQSPAGGSGHQLGLDTVDYDEHGEIRFSGTAPPAAPVRIYVDNTPVGEAHANAQGQWSLTPQAPVSAGLHRFRLDQLASSGQVTGRVELPFQRTAMPTADLAQGRVIVQPGESLWRIARHAYGAGLRYTVIYLANRDQIRDPRRIYPGQAFATPGALP